MQTQATTRQITGARPRPVRPLTPIEHEIARLQLSAEAIWEQADIAERQGRGLDAGTLQRQHDNIKRVIAKLGEMVSRTRAAAHEALKEAETVRADVHRNARYLPLPHAAQALKEADEAVRAATQRVAASNGYEVIQ